MPDSPVILLIIALTALTAQSAAHFIATSAGIYFSRRNTSEQLMNSLENEHEYYLSLIEREEKIEDRAAKTTNETETTSDQKADPKEQISPLHTLETAKEEGGSHRIKSSGSSTAETSAGGSIDLFFVGSILMIILLISALLLS